MKRFLFFILISFFFFSHLSFAGQLNPEKKLKEWGPFISRQQGNVYAESEYEYGWVSIGPRKTNWKWLSNTVLYPVRGQLPYIQINYHQRDPVDDYTLDFGSYLNLKNSTLQIENGFGMNIDYIYKYHLTLNYEHPLYKHLRGNQGLRYLHYTAGDTYLMSPGFIYYFGNHDITASYNIVETEARRVAHSGTVRLRYSLVSDRLHVSCGAGLGQRLYDIYPLNPSKQSGFLLFAGLDMRVFQNLRGNVGYAYGEENPNFIKRSINAGFSFKF